MEVYLNSIEMGNGVYGAQAATQHWYHKKRQQLDSKTRPPELQQSYPIREGSKHLTQVVIHQ
jgi:hypothetical protein